MNFDMGEGVAAKAKDPIKTIKKFIKFLSPHKIPLIAVLIFAIAAFSR